MTSSATISRHRHDCADLRRPQGNQPGLHSTKIPWWTCLSAKRRRARFPHSITSCSIPFSQVPTKPARSLLGGQLHAERVNSLTGLNIQNFIVVDFAGLVKMIDSVGGVDLCIPQNVNDPYTGLNSRQGHAPC